MLYNIHIPIYECFAASIKCELLSLPLLPIYILLRLYRELKFLGERF